MKGTIVSAWVKTCKSLFGDNLTNEALEHFNINPKKIFRPTEDIEDRAAIGFVNYIANKIGEEPYEVWRKMGNNNIFTFSQDYPAFFRYKSLYSFLSAMYDIHVIVTKRIPGAKPPILHMKAIDKKKAVMSYSSPREMFGYFQGMLEGAAMFYKEDIQIDTLEKKEGFTKVSITFSKEIYQRKTFMLNKVLSLGFIKSIEGKIALVSLLLIGIPAVILPKIIDNNLYTATVLALSVIIPLLTGKMLFKPLKDIYLSLESIIEKDLSMEEDISTNDFLEEINDRINSIKSHIKTDFVGYKGSTDELNVFGNKFGEISSNMSFTSGEISDVVEQVASGAINQAEETENAAYLLNNSINSLNQVVDKESKGKEELESAVRKINQGFEDLKATSLSLNQILKEFSKVKGKGQALQNRANDVRIIVETVEKIAEQTNLLALNASIEASRAGEYGRGFTVVALEVRKLAEGSKEAVKSINNNLESFIKDIDGFVDDIDNQYTVLEKENISLTSVAEENYASVNSIKKVANLIIELTEELTKETNSINQISHNIESLAAIAEENSASSQEVSANVQSYTEEIKKMTESIVEFKKVSEEFSKDLEKYTI
ncbi:heme NO-binding domain-containing protein [Tissierella sp. MSJ-40]|uniref:Heme NO-binding domain-containing protein n=1 Tax=Tissierella simiarum TaxID=2841534 RepID=A0ABS6E292_9FIRM|nr:heme NO-binding domain-containing protein [Tissierella simiarum]MBU5437024.1 heme NO-binding domain-containing protein [Tissierella simiarum]